VIDKKKIRKFYRLLEVGTTEHDRSLLVTTLSVSVDYDGRYRSVEECEFDSEEEAIDYALTSKDWEYRTFTILPVYSVSIEV
jgi:hypothetical protein